jgi:hypothetical protein
MVRVIRQPTGDVDGVSLQHYHTGLTYDLPPLLADYLVLQGFAAIEMRRGQRSRRFRPTDRRQQPASEVRQFGGNNGKTGRANEEPSSPWKR